MAVLQKQLDRAGITVLGGEEAVKEIGNLKPAPSAKHEYGTRTLTLEIVRGLDEAVDHIHANGSGHTEAIITGAPLTTDICHVWDVQSALPANYPLSPSARIQVGILRTAVNNYGHQCQLAHSEVGVQAFIGEVYDLNLSA